MVKKILLFVILSSCHLCYSPAQGLGNHGIGTPWCKGKIVLADETEFIGLIRNNDKEGIISVKDYDETENPKSFRQEMVLAMEYFDSATETNRRFISIATKDEGTDAEDVSMYEIIQEFSHFAVLALRHKVIVVESKHNNNALTQNSSTGVYNPSTRSFSPSRTSKTVFSQTEEIYFFNEDGNRELYLSIEHKELDATLYEYSKTKGKIIDSSLPVKYIGEENWNKLKKYAEELDLKFNNRKNLIQVLEYYATLIEQ